MGKELILVITIQDVKYENHTWRKGKHYELQHLDAETDRLYSESTYIDLGKTEMLHLLQDFELLTSPNMLQTERIQCPHCYYVNQEGITDMAVDTGDLDGQFAHECSSCKQTYHVQFIYNPHVSTTKIPIYEGNE
ncbi:hypothetical protein ACOMCU_00745 [Lysinibacillus sp. UGB7]|uniref:hypothetical protein n=1 Tax=Lysinibacillus sp. UGB7 TaxID=3411039 RepID=UPI003B7C19F4